MNAASAAKQDRFRGVSLVAVHFSSGRLEKSEVKPSRKRLVSGYLCRVLTFSCNFRFHSSSYSCVRTTVYCVSLYSDSRIMVFLIVTLNCDIDFLKFFYRNSASIETLIDLYFSYCIAESIS